jgi:2'-5' RNA ligase
MPALMARSVLSRRSRTAPSPAKTTGSRLARSYHPHITLAQDLTHPQSIELAALAHRRWSEYSGSRGFSVESLVFVQNLGGNVWMDLERFQLDYCSSKSPI